ncbi:MAG: hypothetical protein F4X17_02195 [Gemmatimonadetes bacterium]|nr:hypothetical protein [Gemmatimonadota bacterium]MYI64256.1 hypothetical protein [Gemmatimonadota bacterium]
MPIFLPFEDAALQNPRGRTLASAAVEAGERFRHSFFDQSQSGGVKAGQRLRPQLLDQTR